MATPLPTLSSLLGPLNTLQRAISDFEASLIGSTITRKSSDNKVTVVADGQGRVVSITIDVSLVSAGDNVALANTVKSVANSALAAAIAQSAAKAVTFASGLALPGLPAYGAPQPDFVGFGPAVTLVTQTALDNNPCNKARTFQCNSGPAHATVDSDRRIVTLLIDAPLPEPLAEKVSFLQASLVDAINCAIGQATNPPADIHDGVGGIVDRTFGFENLVLYANGAINTGPSLQVLGVGCQGFGTMGNAGSQGTTLGQSSNFGSIVSRAPVIIGSLTHVHGLLQTESVLVADSTVVIDGPTTQNTAVVLPVLQLSANFPTTVENPISLGTNVHASAPPAYYRSITLGGGSQLTLTAGVYFTDALNLATNSKIIVDATNGPVVFWVKNSFTFKGAFVDKAGVFPRIWVGYLGTTGVTLETPYQGSLVAPNAQITLPTVGAPKHVGSFHALHLQVGPSQTICHHPFEIPFQNIPGRV
jgi:DNA-binding protein YbaB